MRIIDNARAIIHPVIQPVIFATENASFVVVAANSVIEVAKLVVCMFAILDGVVKTGVGHVGDAED